MDEFDPTVDPMAQQKAAALLLRRQQQAGSLRGANQAANRFNTLAAVTAMSNNEGAAQAAQLAARNAQSQNKPISLGAQGFALPSTGEFISSPMYEDEREAVRQATRTAAAEKTAAAREAMERRLEYQRDRDEQARALRLTLAQIGQSGANARQSERLDAKQATAAAGGKVLPASNVEKLSKKQGTAQAMADLAGTFKDDFAGTPLLAGTQNTLGRFGLSDKYKDQSNWWQNYQEQTNQIRHELFGSALTAPEKKSFEEATIVPGMASTEIKRRLAQQHRATTSAYNKLKKNFGAAGYNMGQFEDMAEPGVTPLPGQPATNAPAGLQLPPGFKVVGVAP